MSFVELVILVFFSLFFLPLQTSINHLTLHSTLVNTLFLISWWQDNTMLAIGILFLLIVGFLVINIRTRVLKRQKEIFEKEVQERTNLLQEQKNEILVQHEELLQKSEEIAAQRDRIESQHETLETLVQDMEIVGEVGRAITNTLEISVIFEKVYQHLNQLTKAHTFAIGVYNPATQCLDFTEIDGVGKQLHHSYDALTENNRLSVKCFLQKEEIIIHDVEQEKDEYGIALPSAEQNRSVIYLPLIAQQKKVGVITIQTPERHAYDTRQVNIIRTLASYIAIALDNNRAYQVIKTKNQLITDSIQYAQTIQQAILPDHNQLHSAFADFFILFQPKDIVSGDFYWYLPLEEEGRVKHYLAVVDCTGHGVPGAFMSMIGSRILNEVILVKGLRQPDELLELINQSIRIALRQDQLKEGGINTNVDGMDIALLVIDYQKNHIQVDFSGAKLSLYIQEGGELNFLKGNRRSIGGHQWNRSPFTNHSLQLKKGDALYITTDGLLHQNSPEKKKFGRKQFIKQLHQTTALPMDAQKEHIISALHTHQQGIPQRDDMTVIGIRL